MRLFSKLLGSVMAVGIMCSMMCISSFALTAEEQAWLESKFLSVSDQGITSTETWIRGWLVTDPEKSDSEAPLFTTESGVQIYLAEGKTDEELSKQINRTIQNNETVETVSGLTDGLNIGADTQGATALMQGFSPIISLVLGVIVTLVTIGMTVFSAFDIAYIAFPVFRNTCEEAKVQGSGPMVKKAANGQTGLRWVTDDAQYAVSQGTVENGKSPWTIYFKKRIVSYIMLAVVIFILLTGNISLITDIALNIVSGIMNVLEGLR